MSFKLHFTPPLVGKIITIRLTGRLITIPETAIAYIRQIWQYGPVNRQTKPPIHDMIKVWIRLNPSND